ncbi:factor H-binding protein, partial [Neisseria sp. P0001.S002]
GKKKTLQKCGKLENGFLKTDKVSSYDYAQKIKVKCQVITLETGDFKVYKKNYSTVAARYSKQ